MKKRYLRRSIQNILIVITIIMFCFLGSINNFDLKILPLICVFAMITTVNIVILKKYGKGIFDE